MSYNFDSRIIEQRFWEAMAACGCRPIDENYLVIDGQIHRFRLEGDKPSEKSGAYCIYDDNWPAGWFSNWRTGAYGTWSFRRDDLDDNGKSYFADEAKYKEALKRSAEHREQLRAEQAAKQKKAIFEARQLYGERAALPESELPEARKFPYVQDKQIQPFGGVLWWRYYGEEKDGALMIPLYGIDGLIQSIQYILADGTKRFEKDAPVKGAFCKMGLDEAYLKANPNAPILIGEGYATMCTVHAATKYPCAAAMNAGNLYHVAEAIKSKYPDRKIIIMADNDWETAQKGKSNTGLHKANEARDSLGLQAVIYPRFEHSECGSDWNDYEAIHGTEKTSKLLLKLIHYECLPINTKNLLKKVDGINAQYLRDKKFNTVNWAIDGLIPSGLTILAGGPKVGKSIMALHLALGVAIGGCVMGNIDVEKGEVLYLALEDTQRRLQTRINKSNIDENCSLENLDIVTSLPRQDEGGLDYLKYWLSEHSNAKLIIIDTFQKFRKQSSGKLNVYAEDYESLSELKNVADEYNVALVVIHHLKKMNMRQEAENDWMTQLSGSMGISGCADTVLLLKRGRCSTGGTLSITGRDVEEKEYNVHLDGFGWVINGEYEEFKVPPWQKEIITYLVEHDTVTPMELSDNLKITIESARKQLQRATQAGVTQRINHGVYKLSKRLEQ